MPPLEDDQAVQTRGGDVHPRQTGRGSCSHNGAATATPRSPSGAASARNARTLPRRGCADLRRRRLQGERRAANESMLLAMGAARLKIPLIVTSGDDQLATEARRQLPWVQYATVKHAVE